jgi:hypothetical protein
MRPASAFQPGSQLLVSGFQLLMIDELIRTKALTRAAALKTLFATVDPQTGFWWVNSTPEG